MGVQLQGSRATAIMFFTRTRALVVLGAVLGAVPAESFMLPPLPPTVIRATVCAFVPRGASRTAPLRTSHRDMCRLSMSLDDELAGVRGMKIREIKQELAERGLATDDIFEKDEFVTRLAQARVEKPSPTSAPTSAPSGTGSSSSATTRAESSQQDRDSVVRAEVEVMRVAEIRAELSQRAVSSHGLFEKSEFVELLVKARLAAPGDGDSNKGTSRAATNPEYKDVQTKKMDNKKQEPQTTSTAGGSRGGGGGGMGGNPFGGMPGACVRQQKLCGRGWTRPVAYAVERDLLEHLIDRRADCCRQCQCRVLRQRN